MRYHHGVDDVAATCLDRSVVERGLRNLGASWNPQIPGAFASTLERMLVHAELDGTATPTATDVCFTGAAQAAADLLVEASRRVPSRFGTADPGPPPPPSPAPSLQGLTGWAALGAAVVTAGVVFGPGIVKKLSPPKRRRRKARP